CYLYFFFQAEDGIRDRNVTGVQTCALPISINIKNISFKIAFPSSANFSPFLVKLNLPFLFLDKLLICSKILEISTLGTSISFVRSEERRVGKECLSYCSLSFYYIQN